MNSRKIIFFTSAIFIFLLSSIYITYPLIFHFGDRVTGFGDELIISWIQNWVMHAVTTNPFSLFEANIYYPYHNTLAYSDLFITSSVLSFIPLKLIGQPIVAQNFTFFSSLFLVGFCTFFLTFYISKNFFSSIISGLLIIFSPAMLDKKVHLQILAIEWIPLAILFFLMFHKTKKTRFLIFSMIFFLFQTYNSFLPGYFLFFFYLIFLIYLFFYRKSELIRMFSKSNILIVLLAILVIVPIAIPYYKVSAEFRSVRDIRDTIHFALQPEDFIYAGQDSRLHTALLNIENPSNYPQNAEIKPGFIGLIFTFLSVIALYVFIKNFKERDLIYNSLVTTGLVGFILSFGPLLHIHRVTIHKPFPIILPYAAFYYIMPGFKGIRNSARFEVLFIFGIAVAIGLVLPKLLGTKNLKNQFIIYFLIVIGIISEFNFPLQFMKIEQVNKFPKVYSWLATTPKNAAYIDMPIYNWNMDPFVSVELMREYYSTIHFRRAVNGYSGFSPPPWQAFVTFIMDEFPSKKSIEKLRQIKVNYVIVHADEYNNIHSQKFRVDNKIIANGDSIITFLKSNPSLHLVEKLGNTYVFQLK